MSDLRELGKQLPYERPDAERREALRSSLLVAASQDDAAAKRAATARKRWWFVGGGFAAGALAAAAIAVVVISPRGRTEPAIAPAPAREAQARVDAPATARLEHTVTATSTGTDELVRVRAGVVRVAVPEVKRGDRVRMQTADAEVEGTGTYEVAVVDDRLERVSVRDGSAHLTVRVDGTQQQIFLATGQTWRPKIVTADLEVAPPAEVETKPAPSKTPPSPPAPVARMPAVTSLTIEPPQTPSKQKTATEQHFQAGWALLRDGKAREAAVELGAAADAGGRADPLAADARYFQAVALVRTGDAAAAERVLVTFLDSAPASLRRGRAALLLGKILRDRGDPKSARSWFETARDDADPAIAAAARAHLDALR